jgi:hypothetical protein
LAHGRPIGSRHPRAAENNMTFNELAFRATYALRTNPSVRVLVGVVMIGVGVLELIVGAGQGRLIVFGVLLIAGASTAARGRLHRSDHENAPPHGADEPPH